MRACRSRSACACRDMASCSAGGICTSRISTDCTVMPHGLVFSSRMRCSSCPSSSRSATIWRQLVASDRFAQRRLRAERDGLREVLHFQDRLSPRSTPSRTRWRPRSPARCRASAWIPPRRWPPGPAGPRSGSGVSTIGIMWNIPGPRSPTYLPEAQHRHLLPLVGHPDRKEEIQSGQAAGESPGGLVRQGRDASAGRQADTTNSATPTLLSRSCNDRVSWRHLLFF